MKDTITILLTVRIFLKSGFGRLLKFINNCFANAKWNSKNEL